ncbi:TRAP transporter small permease [Pelistega europaea]|uniref:TRAP transporter small permease protein n=1 Tax=Pelistega europaea TaxID=106147 RepID=A0A7Y4P3L2_9BURK|nr:TRAP transporter small permease [Pelistega europaea]NOL48571.1 TRAP transporter small permease [Pelistega europaea]
MADINPIQKEVQEATVPRDKLGLFLLRWSQISAFIAVILLIAICITSTISVVSRWLFNQPVTGDVELVQIACALAISAFLPYAQMKNSHIIVDFFTVKASPLIKDSLDLIAALLLAIVSALLTWRSAEGAISTYKWKTTTMILGWPEWIAHITIAPGFALLCLTALYTAYIKLRSLRG